jgi:hypothetical protein
VWPIYGDCGEVGEEKENDNDSVKKSCWIIREQGDRVIEGVNLINVWYIHVWNTELNHPWTINAHLKNEGQEGKRGPI